MTMELTRLLFFRKLPKPCKPCGPHGVSGRCCVPARCLSRSRPHFFRVNFCNQLLKVEICSLWIRLVLPSGYRLDQGRVFRSHLLKGPEFTVQTLLEQQEQASIRKRIAVLQYQIVCARQEVTLECASNFAGRL